MALNREQLRQRRKEVSFMRHILTVHGVKLDPEKAKAVQEMPKPEEVEGIPRFSGFLNCLTKFLLRLADIMEPIRTH